MSASIVGCAVPKLAALKSGKKLYTYLGTSTEIFFVSMLSGN